MNAIEEGRIAYLTKEPNPYPFSEESTSDYQQWILGYEDEFYCRNY